MSHKARARNARPYGHGGVMRSSFFRNIVGARIARPLLEFVQNFGFAHLLGIWKIAKNHPRERKVGASQTPAGVNKDQRLAIL